MAIATAVCRCRVCGETFTKSTKRRNRTEADSWEQWAVKNIDLCPKCWGKEQREKEIARGLCARVALGNPYDDYPYYYVIFEGDTMPYKDTLKSLGCRWTQEYPTEQDSFGGGMLYGLFTQMAPFRWVIPLPVANDDVLPRFFGRIKDAGLQLAETELPTDAKIAMWCAAVATVAKSRAEEQSKQAAEIAEKQVAIAAKIAELGKIPAWDDDINSLWPDGITWNGKFYGKAGCWSVYFGNKKIDLTDDQQRRMEQTQTARAEWRKKKQNIERGSS